MSLRVKYGGRVSPSLTKKPSGWLGLLHQVWSPNPQDQPVIDGLRGMSILLIVLFHSFYGVLFVLRGFEPILAFLNEIPFSWSFITGSDKAVDIFFVVSAYLLGTSLFKRLEGQGSSPTKNKQVLILNKRQMAVFYGKRIARIYPLYLLGLILYAPINLKQSLRNLPYNLLFIDNFDFSCIIPVGWSLSIEMQFYLLLPWIAKGLYRYDAKVQIRILGAFFALSFITSIVVCLIYPEIYQTHFYNFHPNFVDPTTMMDRLYYPTHTRYGPLVLGLIWALCTVHRPYAHKLEQYFSGYAAKQGIFIVLGIVLMYGMMLFPVYQPNSFYYRHFSPVINLILHASHRNLFCVGLLLMLTPVMFSGQGSCGITSGVRRLLSWRIFRPFSQVVFPIYLFHFPMIALAGLAVFQTTQIKNITHLTIVDVLAIFAFASAFSLILGIVLHGLIEKPMMERGYRWAENFSRRFS